MNPGHPPFHLRSEDGASVAIRDGRTSTEVLRRSEVDAATGDERVVSREYAMLDRAGRMQLPAEYMQALGMRDRVALELEPTRAPASDGAPVALLFSEALVNALRHAFPGGRSGRVAVSLRNGHESYVLTVADDGVGAGDAPKGFGSMVIQLLAQQLRAKLSAEPTQPGWRLSVSVPMNTPAPPA